ncbi:TatD family hydrolase [Stetteria hydrogenophila]
MAKLLFADGHGHSNPVKGMGAGRIAERFKQAGGWFMALVALSPTSYSIEPRGFEAYKEVVDVHIRECSQAEEAGVKVACLAGFHPADVDKLIDKYKMDPVEVLNLGYRVVDYVASLCREGVLDGIGEVGRQHYRTTAEKALVSALIMERALEAARDNGCVVHLHLENAGAASVRLTHIVAERLGLRPTPRVVFHHSKPSMAVEAAKLGYSATLPGIPRLLEHAVRELEPVYVVESDFLDDPARPGVVVYPWDIAEAMARLHRRGVVSEEYLYRVNVDNVVKIYGVEPP